MTRSVFWLLCLFSGCICNTGLISSSASEQNVSNLTRLSSGMHQKAVLRVMRHPYSQQTFHMDDDIYDVWFYVTNPSVLGQCRLLPRNLTPLAFKNGVLIGWGFAYYNYLKKRLEAAEKPPRIEKHETPSENIEFEKILAPPENEPKRVPESSQPLSMSSRHPQTPTPEKATPSSSMTKKEKEAPQKPQPPPLSEEEEEMIEEGAEQNFNQD